MVQIRANKNIFNILIDNSLLLKEKAQLKPQGEMIFHKLYVVFGAN